MPKILVEPISWWFLPAFAYACFCFWMLCSCVYREEDRDERLSWSIMLALFGGFAAPVYYWKRYRQLRAERLKEEANAEAEMRSVITRGR